MEENKVVRLTLELQNHITSIVTRKVIHFLYTFSPDIGDLSVQSLLARFREHKMVYQRRFFICLLSCNNKKLLGSLIYYDSSKWRSWFLITASAIINYLAEIGSIKIRIGGNDNKFGLPPK